VYRALSIIQQQQQQHQHQQHHQQQQLNTNNNNNNHNTVTASIAASTMVFSTASSTSITSSSVSLSTQLPAQQSLQSSSSASSSTIITSEQYNKIVGLKLITTHACRKFSGIFDLIISYFTSEYLVFNIFGVITALFGIYIHHSQNYLYRQIFIIVSSYSYMNSFAPI
jgi:uncharacterized membrane protein